MSLPVSFECKDRFVDLGFDGDLDVEIIPDRGQTGKTKSLIIFPLGEFGMSGGNQRLPSRFSPCTFRRWHSRRRRH